MVVHVCKGRWVMCGGAGGGGGAEAGGCSKIRPEDHRRYPHSSFPMYQQLSPFSVQLVHLHFCEIVADVIDRVQTQVPCGVLEHVFKRVADTGLIQTTEQNG